MRLLDVVIGIFDPGNELDEEQRSLAAYLTALDRRDGLIAAWEGFLEDVDVLVLPSAMSTAFPHADEYGAVDIDGLEVGYLEHGGLLTFANLAGLPALAVPASLGRDGLPIGVQLVGPRWSDGRLIAIARACEESQVLPGFRVPPLLAPRA